MTITMTLTDTGQLTFSKHLMDYIKVKLSAECNKSQTKLAQFSAKVPQAIVLREQERLTDWENQLATLRQKRDHL